jgi:YesN/AraC family two-component response regulator
MAQEKDEPLTSDLIRVVIVEDDRATREGLAMLIDGTPGYRSVGRFRSVEEALSSAGREAPDVRWWD